MLELQVFYLFTAVLLPGFIFYFCNKFNRKNQYYDVLKEIKIRTNIRSYRKIQNDFKENEEKYSV